MNSATLTLPISRDKTAVFFVGVQSPSSVMVQVACEENGRRALIDGTRNIWIRPGEAATFMTDGRDWYSNRTPFIHVPGRTWAGWWKKFLNYVRRYANG